MLTTSIIILALFVCAFGGFVIYDLVTAKKRKVVYRVKSSATAYLMLLPSVALAFLFILLPILYSLGYAFTDYYLLQPNNIKFIQFENFVNLFKELSTKGMLYNAIKNYQTIRMSTGMSIKELFDKAAELNKDLDCAIPRL